MSGPPRVVQLAIQETPPPASIQINSGSSQGRRLGVLAQSNPSRIRLARRGFLFRFLPGNGGNFAACYRVLAGMEWHDRMGH